MSVKKTALITVMALFAMVSLASAQITVNPGSTSPTLQAHDCAYLSDGLIGECFDCGHECNLDENKARARVAVESLDIGKRLITTTVYSEFTVGSDPDNDGNVVSSVLNYDVQWNGYWTFTTAIVDYNPHTKIYLWVTDLTRDQKMENVTLHEIDNSSLGSIDIVDIGAGWDRGSETGEISMNLIRGNRYRVHLSVTLECTAFSAGVLKIDYLTLSKGAWWNDLKVKISPDLEERIAALEERVDSLENMIGEIRDDLDHHAHSYLTGKGEGHNNVEATTGLAIFFDDSTSEADNILLGIDDENFEPLPKKSTLYPNYPNPFNPSTTISYSLPSAANVKIYIYNSLGQKVTTLVDQAMSAGEHSVLLDATDWATGVYFYRLETDRYAETRKLVLLK